MILRLSNILKLTIISFVSFSKTQFKKRVEPTFNTVKLNVLKVANYTYNNLLTSLKLVYTALSKIDSKLAILLLVTITACIYYRSYIYFIINNPIELISLSKVNTTESSSKISLSKRTVVLVIISVVCLILLTGLFIAVLSEKCSRELKQVKSQTRSLGVAIYDPHNKMTHDEFTKTPKGPDYYYCNPAGHITDTKYTFVPANKLTYKSGTSPNLICSTHTVPISDLSYINSSSISPTTTTLTTAYTSNLNTVRLVKEFNEAYLKAFYPNSILLRINDPREKFYSIFVFVLTDKLNSQPDTYYIKTELVGQQIGASLYYPKQPVLVNFIVYSAYNSDQGTDTFYGFHFDTDTIEIIPINIRDFIFGLIFILRLIQNTKSSSAAITDDIVDLSPYVHMEPINTTSILTNLISFISCITSCIITITNFLCTECFRPVNYTNSDLAINDSLYKKNYSPVIPINDEISDNFIVDLPQEFMSKIYSKFNIVGTEIYQTELHEEVEELSEELHEEVEELSEELHEEVEELSIVLSEPEREIPPSETNIKPLLLKSPREEQSYMQFLTKIGKDFWLQLTRGNPVPNDLIIIIN
jgi:hypothetical protein